MSMACMPRLIWIAVTFLYSNHKRMQVIKIVGIYWTFTMCQALCIISLTLHNNPVMEALTLLVYR